MGNIHITDEEREAVYKTIFSRRDVRKEFIQQAISEEVLMRVLTAAHHAPSVGFMQPWDFIVVGDREVKRKIKQAFELARMNSEREFEAGKIGQYRALKLEGITEAPIGICVTCDKTRNGPVVIGRSPNPQMDLFSSVCAIQNLWLAARAENLGMGWVSIIENEDLRSILGIPKHIVPVAYLCLGYVSNFHDEPDLKRAGWLSREHLDDLIHYDQWGGHSYRNTPE
jgi:5,6-dimethylbenzimidazole synthase